MEDPIKRWAESLPREQREYVTGIESELDQLRTSTKTLSRSVGQERKVHQKQAEELATAKTKIAELENRRSRMREEIIELSRQVKDLEARNLTLENARYAAEQMLQEERERHQALRAHLQRGLAS